MREPKFDVGDVVRIIGDESGRHNGELAEVIAVGPVDWTFDDVLEIRTSSGICVTVPEKLVQPVTLEEVQEHYADKPRRGFIVDGLTVDELESGQDETYEIFRRAAKEAEAVNEGLEKRARQDLITMIVFWIAANVIAMLAWLVCLDRLEETMPALIGMYSTVMGVLSVIEMALMTGAWKRLRKGGRGGEDPHIME